MRKAGIVPSHPPIIEDETPFVPSRGWAEMIRKVYEIDPLLLPKLNWLWLLKREGNIYKNRSPLISN